MNSEENFNKITKAISSNEKYANIVHDVCRLPHVMNIKEFYEVCAVEEKAIVESYDQQAKCEPTIQHFQEVFKKLNEFPSNLQIKKQTRLNSSITLSSTTLNESASFATYKTTSLSSLHLNKLGDVPTASETFKSFEKYQKQLKQLHAEILENDLEKEYVNKLKQLKTFSQQLEKLLPTEKLVQPALTPDEEESLETLDTKMNDMQFIRKFHDMFQQQDNLSRSVTQKVESLNDILSYCLLNVNSNINF